MKLDMKNTLLWTKEYQNQQNKRKLETPPPPNTNSAINLKKIKRVQIPNKGINSSVSGTAISSNKQKKNRF